jgi:hypothetical protein
MLITIRSVLFMIAKGMGAFGLGGLILWQVAASSGGLNGLANVHVTTANVDVTLDDVQYHVETLWDSPIVCELSPGHHMLRMLRNGQVLYEEELTLGVRQEVVLVAWEPRNEKPAHADAPNQSHNHAKRSARTGQTRH